MAYRPPAPAQVAPVGYANAASERYCAYNQTRKRFLSANVEAADFSPIVFEARLPVLTQSHDFALWHLPFRGIPPALISEPLDLVYLDAECVVLETVEAFPISQVSPTTRPASSLLALKAGTIESSGTQRGDQLFVCGAQEMKRRLKHAAQSLSHDSIEKLTALSDLFTAIDLSKEIRTRSTPFIVDGNALPQPATPASEVGANTPAAFQIGKQPKNWLERLLNPRDPRKNGREAVEGLVAYFFTGGVPVPHEVRDVGSGGIYIFTEERWSPDTILRLTLTDVREPSIERSLTVNARVIRWGNDGVGFKFVLKNHRKNKRHRNPVEDQVEGVTKEAIAEFLGRLRNKSI